MRIEVQSLALTGGLRVSCGVGHRCASDPKVPWLWHRPEAAALIRALAWELPYAAGAALKKLPKKEKKKKFQKIQIQNSRLVDLGVGAGIDYKQICNL